jgi:hypothetical protein
MKILNPKIVTSLLRALMILALGLASTAAGAYDAAWRFCAFTGGGTLGAPINNPPPPHCCSGPPLVDGAIDNDPGWTRAWRYVFNNGTPVHDVATQAVADATSMWLSFDVSNDQALNVADTIVIAVDGSDGRKRLLQINPLQNGAVRATAQVLFWDTDSAGSFSGGGGAPPFAVDVKTTASGAIPNVRWIVEVKLPLVGLHVSSAADFGLYTNVLVQQGSGAGPTALVNEYAWPLPASSALWLLGDTLALPSTANWGTATVAERACNGVSIDNYGIGTLNSPNTKILLGRQNTFRAVVKNNSVDSAGQPTVVASQITAKFSYATFGVSTTWTPITADAGSSNPSGPGAVPANGQANFDTKWTVPANDPNFPDGGKTCVRVDLDSLAPAGDPWTTVFVNRSSWNNFHFATASKVASGPVIDTRGWLPPASGTDQKVELFLSTKIDAISRDVASRGAQDPNSDAAHNPDKPASDRPGNPWTELASLTPFPVEKNASFKEYAEALLASSVQVSQLVQLTHACRRSGKFITIGSESLEVCERMGSYGHAIRHAGLGKTDWTVAVEGQRNPTHLSLSIPAGTRQTLKVEFTGKTKDRGFCATLGGQHAAFGGATLALLGFVVYRPRRRKIKL